ncbi:MAG: 3'(2'),5'-bisphosphate nucleotidase CysQ [Bacteroidales bacterium]|nr:3'(2'),5'-bisphosphate nucleotidase CysQ [Bacteroidales bacterium]
MELLLKIAQHSAREAGKAIMEVYAQPFEVYTKDDDSPVTQADLRASNIIKEILKPTGLPFVSEEDLPTDRSQFKRYWLVDPLDGTAEFVKRNGEFTVNIALIDNAQPVLGVIYAPVLDRLWYAVGTHRVCPQLSTRTHAVRPYTVLVSRSHRTPEVDEYINKVLRPAHPDLVIDTQGSSLKFARLAEGSADIYVCYSKTKEWDTAAADAILRAAGGKVLRISDGQPLEYSKTEYPNPPFVAWAKAPKNWP